MVPSRWFIGRVAHPFAFHPPLIRLVCRTEDTEGSYLYYILSSSPHHLPYLVCRLSLSHIHHPPQSPSHSSIPIIPLPCFLPSPCAHVSCCVMCHSDCTLPLLQLLCTLYTRLRCIVSFRRRRIPVIFRRFVHASSGRLCDVVGLGFILVWGTALLISPSSSPLPPTPLHQDRSRPRHHFCLLPLGIASFDSKSIAIIHMFCFHLIALSKSSVSYTKSYCQTCTYWIRIS